MVRSDGAGGALARLDRCRRIGFGTMALVPYAGQAFPLEEIRAAGTWLRSGRFGRGPRFEACSWIPELTRTLLLALFREGVYAAGAARGLVSGGSLDDVLWLVSGQ